MKKKIGDKVGKFIVGTIVERTRGEGKGVKIRGGNRQPLKSLAQSTIRSRRYKKLHVSTSPETSNLTETGKMLDDLTYKTFVRKDAIHFEIYFRSRAMDIRATWVSKDRPFLELGKAELREISQIAEKLIENELKNLKV